MFGEENEIDYVKFWELTFGLAMCVCGGGGVIGGVDKSSFSGVNKKVYNKWGKNQEVLLHKRVEK